VSLRFNQLYYRSANIDKTDLVSLRFNQLPGDLVNGLSLFLYAWIAGSLCQFLDLDCPLYDLV
jgi:hypothetical protein